MHTINEGNGFNIIVVGQERTGGTVANIDMSTIDDMMVYLVKAGRGRKAMAYAVNDEGKAVLSIDAGMVSKGIYGIEVTGSIDGVAVHAQQPTAFMVVDGYTQHGDMGGVIYFEVHLVMVVNAAASRRYVEEAVAAEAKARQAADEALYDALGRAGKVDDVLIDGESILDPETKVANIDSSQFGKVDDVKVNGISVLDPQTKEANINITASVVEDDTPGDPTATATMQDENINIEFAHVKGEKGEKGDKGDKGNKGDSFQPIEDVSGLVMAHALGDDDTKAMSQMGVSFPVNQTKSDLGGNGQILQLTEVGYINASGVLKDGSGYHRTDKIPVEIGMSIKYKGKIGGETFPCVAGYGEDESYYGALLLGSSEGYADFQTIYIPAGVAYIAVASTDGVDTSVLMNYGLTERVASDEGVLTELDNTVGKGDTFDFDNEGYIQPAGSVKVTEGYLHTDAIPVKAGDVFYFKGKLNSTYPCIGGYVSDTISANNYHGVVLAGGDYNDLTPVTIPQGVTHIVAVSRDDVPYELNNLSGLVKRVNYLEKELAKIIPFHGLPNEYYGKKINWIGDSITAGKDFDELVCAYFGLIETDYGIDGSTIAADENDTKNSIAIRYVDMSDEADVIVVSAGTNDYQYAHTPVGTINDNDVHTFYGALKVLCEGLIAKYPTKLVFFTTPIKRNQSPLNTSQNVANALGYTLSQYADIIKEVCALYSIPVCDLWRESYLNPHLAAQASMFDNYGTHPNDAGRALMARRVRGFMKQLI